MIDTIDQKWKLFNRFIATVGPRWSAWLIVLIDIIGIDPYRFIYMYTYAYTYMYTCTYVYICVYFYVYVYMYWYLLFLLSFDWWINRMWTNKSIVIGLTRILWSIIDITD